ncbi:hypothetical protein CK475_25120 [Enterobacter cloacae]|nr:hypothetical protein CK475_25120 [Enterobacter cloacae]
MPEIQYLAIIPAILILSRSTDFNVHLPTDVGTDDGISGSIMLVPTGREQHGKLIVVCLNKVDMLRSNDKEEMVGASKHACRTLM